MLLDKLQLTLLELIYKSVTILNLSLILLLLIMWIFSRQKSEPKTGKGEIDDIYVSTKGLAKELQLPIWSVSQVNRAGAKDDVIEGDKAAGSYDKIMITDVAISLIT